jgi:hypothetical protein
MAGWRNELVPAEGALSSSYTMQCKLLGRISYKEAQESKSTAYCISQEGWRKKSQRLPKEDRGNGNKIDRVRLNRRREKI